MENDEVKVWDPKHPRVAAVGEYLKRVRDASFLGSLIAGNKGDLLEKIAYGDKLTSGKGQTFGLHPDLTEIADVIPSAKGVKSAVVVGPVGLMGLDSPKLTALYKKIAARLQSVGPKDWLTQKTIVEDMGGIPIPRGRDITPDKPTIRFGVEVPEGEITHDLLKATYGLPTSGKQVMKTTLPLEEAYSAPALLRAYPSLKKIRVTGDETLGPGAANITFDENRIGLGKHTNPSWLDEVMAHEVQHKIQHVENWPQGTNTVVARALLTQLKDPISEAEIKLAKKQADLLRKMDIGPANSSLAGTELYRREAGEEVARAAAASHVAGGGLVNKAYETPFYQMYDDRIYPFR